VENILRFHIDISSNLWYYYSKLRREPIKSTYKNKKIHKKRVKTDGAQTKGTGKMNNDIKILIADENAEFRASLKNALYARGAKTVYEASNGDDALLMIKKTHPDFALIDIWLPKKDCIRLMRAMENVDFTPDAPPSFILLSSVTGDGKGIPLTMIIVALIYISQQIYEGVTVADNISQLTHIIGGSIGAVYGLALRGRK
jgi:CheY-like chemotaxis protein